MVKEHMGREVWSEEEEGTWRRGVVERWYDMVKQHRGKLEKRRGSWRGAGEVRGGVVVRCGEIA